MSRNKSGASPVLWGWLFNLPMVLFLGLLVLIPVLGTIWQSLFQDIAFMDRQFTGFDNYLALVNDESFWQVCRFTLLFVLISVPLELVLGLIFALILTQAIPLRGLWRALVLIPWAIPAAISARTFELIYNVRYGLANWLKINLGFGEQAVNWLGSDWGAFFALVLADAWKTTPFVAIILMAGLASIPDDLNKQAQIDGAHFIQRFFRITLPLLKPVILVALLFRTIDALRIFDLNYVLTGGGPGGATTSFSLYGYRFFLSGDFGYGAAVSSVLFIIALVFSIVYLKAGKFEKEMS